MTFLIQIPDSVHNNSKLEFTSTIIIYSYSYSSLLVKCKHQAWRTNFSQGCSVYVLHTTHFQLTRSNIFTNFPSCFDLFNKHPKYQHPPINMHNKQAVQKTVEQIIIYWTIHSVLFLIQRQQNFITDTKGKKQLIRESQ